MCHDELLGAAQDGSSSYTGWIGIPVEDGEMPTYIASPPLAPVPTVLILHDIFGANEFYQDLARRLAVEGFLALLPDLFARQGPLPEQNMDAARARGQRLNEDQVVSDMKAALSYLEAAASGNGAVGVIGFCMGGTLAFLAAARQPLPAACVAWYGFPAGRQGWQHRPISESHAVQAPLLAFWGDQDGAVGMDNVEQYDLALTLAEKPHNFIVYPGVSHGFLTFDPVAALAAVSLDSWTRTLAFLREALPV